MVDVDATGTLRWEAAPGWDGGGAFVLWTAAEKPSHALKWSKGDLKGFWSVTVRANWRIIFRFEDGAALDVELIDYH